MNLKNEILLSALKARYFELISKERYPDTPNLTKEADELEGAIKELQKKVKDDENKKTS